VIQRGFGALRLARIAATILMHRSGRQNRKMKIGDRPRLLVSFIGPTPGCRNGKRGLSPILFFILFHHVGHIALPKVVEKRIMPSPD
jgi:hypothetical protein